VSNLDILVVDDEVNWQELLPRVLGRLGGSVSVKAVGKLGQALTQIDTHTYQLAVVDLRLLGDAPGEGDTKGNEFIKALRASPRNYNCAVVLLSALAGLRDVRDAFADAGADDYFDKNGFRGDKFLNVCRQVLRKRSLQRRRGVSMTIDLSPFGDASVSTSGDFQFVSNRYSVPVDWERWQREMRDLGDIVFDYHDWWLYALDSGDAARAEEYETKRDRWRPRVASMGRDLYREVFPGVPKLMETLGELRQVVAPVFADLLLRFSGPHTSLSLPLESLHDGNIPLAILHPLCRQLSDSSSAESPWRVFLRDIGSHPLQVLLIAAHQGAPVDEVQLVATQLREDFESLDIKVQITPEDLSRPMGSELITRHLESGFYHLVHFAGHAHFAREQPENSYLRLYRENGEVDELRTAKLAGLLRQGQPPRFVFFSCCAGAEIADEDKLRDNSYLGLMHAAVKAGVPAVFGYRWPVSDQAAINYARHFYDGLGRYHSLEHATWWARKQVFETSPKGGRDETWFSPILVVQNPDQIGGSHA
jgi:CheY-like chemotaxis protein